MASGIVRLVPRMQVIRDAPIDALTHAQAVERLADAGSKNRTRFWNEDLVDGAQWLKVYLDFDLLLPAGFDDVNDVCAAAEAEVRARMDALVEDLRSRIYPEAYYVLARRHGFSKAKGQHKLSLRPFVSGIAVKRDDLKELLQHLQVSSSSESTDFWRVGELHSALARASALPTLLRKGKEEAFWDGSVYLRRGSPGRHKLAAIFCAKDEDDLRVLEPCDSEPRGVHERASRDPADFLAQVVQPSWEPIDSDLVRKLASAREVGGGGVRSTGPNQGGASEFRAARDPTSAESPEQLAQLVACLAPARADDYDQWIRVAAALQWAARCEEDREALFATFLEFSKPSPKFRDEADCRATWDSFGPGSNHPRPVTTGTLCSMAKEDNRDAYDAWRRAWPAKTATMTMESRVESAARDAGLADAEECAALAAKLCKTWPAQFTGLEGRELRMLRNPANPKSVRFVFAACASTLQEEAAERAGGGNPAAGTIYPDYSVEVDGVGELGLLARDTKITALHTLHTGINYHTTFEYTREPGYNLATLKALDSEERTSIEITAPYSDKPSVRVNIGRVKKDVCPSKAKWLVDYVTSEIEKCATSQAGLPSVRGIINIVNIGSLNVNILGDGIAAKLSDEDIAQLVLTADPEFSSRTCLVPDMRSNNSSGIYHCDATTNRWAHCSYPTMERYILKKTEGARLNWPRSASFLLESVHGRRQITYAAACANIDEHFLDRLDANPDLFAVDNGVFDLRTKGFRALRPEDRVSVTAGWAYDADEARRRRPELEAFLAQVLPVPDERRAVLCWVASHLSGHKTLKKFLALTDRRGGNNGKTATVQLLVRFFGRYVAQDTKFVCRGSFAQDRNSHDAGLEPMRGKRLIVAEELKNSMQLDVAMLKAYTGGPGMRIQGRRCGSSAQFEYTWQAGFLLVFNEGDFPRFDEGDQAFLGRMVVAPFRAKFVAPEEVDAAQADDPLTFARDPNVAAKFPTWCSALADILLEHFDAAVACMDSLPPAMSEWRQDIANEANPLAEFLVERLTVTGLDTDYVLVSDLKAAYFATDRHGSGVQRSAFMRLVKAYFSMVPGVRVADQKWINKANVRGVILGVREAA